MSTSLREQILARVQAVIAAGGTGAVLVARSREQSITKAQTPAVTVRPIATEIVKQGGQERHELEFALEIFVRGDPWETLADPVDVACHAAILADLRATAAPSLGSFVADVDRIGETFEAQEADRTAGTLTVRFRAAYLVSKQAIDRAW